jgi:hypothetical protein
MYAQNAGTPKLSQKYGVKKIAPTKRGRRHDRQLQKTTCQEGQEAQDAGNATRQDCSKMLEMRDRQELVMERGPLRVRREWRLSPQMDVSVV